MRVKKGLRDGIAGKECKISEKIQTPLEGRTVFQSSSFDWMKRSGLQGIDINAFFLRHPDPFPLSQNLKMSDGFGDT